MEAAEAVSLMRPFVSRPGKDARLRLTGPDGRLTLELMHPAAADRYYPGTRFSPAAFLLQAHYDAVPYFFLPACPDPTLGEAGGAPMEFDLGEGTQPPGYESAPVGGSFVKIGVGPQIRLSGEPYGFWRENPPAGGAPVRVEWDTHRAVFRQQLLHWESGIGYRLTATVRAERSAAVFDVRLENSGFKPFRTEQYMHNFLAIGTGVNASELELEFPFSPVAESHQATPGILDAVRISGRRLRAVRPRFSPGKLALSAPSGCDMGGTLWLRRIGSSRALRIDSSLPVSRWALFLSPEQVSPEAFVRLRLLPGETAELRRTYTFYS